MDSKTAKKMAQDIISNMMKARKFRVVRTVPEDFEFYGPVPFDLKIRDGIMIAEVYATSMEEAWQQVNEYLDKY